MKRSFLAVFLLGMTNLCAFAQAAVTLDEAIKTAADEIGGRLEKGTKIAVLNFKSTSQALSAYMVEELNNALVNDGRSQVQARNQDVMNIARQELNFNDSEEVSNKSAQQIGRMLGAQTFVNGSIEKVGNIHRLRIQVLEVETLTIRYSKSLDVQNDRRIKILMAGPNAAYEDYTTAERTATAALNLVFGIGSYIQKDIVVGGIVTGIIETPGFVLLIVGAGNRDYYYGKKSKYESGSSDAWVTEKEAEDNIKSAEGLMIAGGVIYAAGAIYGAIRAFTVHKPGYVASIAEPFNIALVSDHRGNSGLQLSYTMHY